MLDFNRVNLVFCNVEEEKNFSTVDKVRCDF